MNSIARSLIVVVVASLLGGCRETLEPEVGVPPSDPSGDWGDLLRTAVTRDGYVDYDKIEAHFDVLEAYVAWMGSDRVLGGKKTADHHGFYLNAYNALTIYQVLDRGRPASVLDPKGWVPAPGAKFFLLTDFQVGPDKLSLSEIENERIRQKELDFRDHAAMNCASRSCPPMNRELYGRGAALQSQLKAQMERWIADDARGVYIDGEMAVFSPIFDWYGRDFSFLSAGMDPCAVAAKYAVGPKRKKLVELSELGCPHSFMEYDWSLNDASGL